MSQLTNISDYSNTTADSFQLCEDHPEGLFFWICVSIVSFVFGFPGTIVILLEMLQKRRKGTLFTPSDVFAFNLTVMDGIYLFFLLPELYFHLHGDHEIRALSSKFFFSFNICGRPLFVTLVSLDCYLAVVHPVIYRARKSLTPRILMAIGVWIVTVSSGLLLVTINSDILTSSVAVVFCVFVLPIVGFCDFCIIWKLSKSSPGGGNLHPRKKRALLIIINNLILTCFSYIPPLIILLISPQASVSNTFNCLVMVPVMCASILGTTISVILFLIHLGKLDCLK